MNWQKRHYDKKCKAAQLAPGDLVLLQKDAVVGRPKLQDRWSEELYQVMDCKVDDMPVYVITSTRTGNEKVVHRNKLLVVQLANDLSESQVIGNEQPLQPQLVVEGLLKGNELHLELPAGGAGTELEVRDTSASASTLRGGAT